MWRKFLAVACIPFAGLLALASVNGLLTSLANAPKDDGGYQLGYYAGVILCLLFFSLLLFFWGRWIWRTLDRPATGRHPVE